MKASPPQPSPEQLTRDLRHDLRNRLTAIRNAAFYIQRKAEHVGLPDDEPRVKRFFELIIEQLDEADDAIASRLTAEFLLPSHPNKTQQD